MTSALFVRECFIPQVVATQCLSEVCRGAVSAARREVAPCTLACRQFLALVRTQRGMPRES